MTNGLINRFEEGNIHPSSWKHRKKLLLIAAVGFCIALYLGLYQVNVFTTVWDPLFGSGSEKVLHSSFSKALPIPDALMGAFAYLFDIVFDSIGDEYRWKTKPWVVIIFGAGICFFALVSLFLIFAQAFIIKSFCTLCLASAFLSLCLVPLGAKEFVATLQYLKLARERGDSVWKIALGKASGRIIK